MTTPKTPTADRYPPLQDEQEDPSIIYPSSDGEPLAENDWQYIAISDTAAALRDRYKDRNDVYVAADMLVYYKMNDVNAKVAPDVYVVFGAQGNHRRDSWLVWREGKSLDFVLEVASPGTWDVDAGRKRDTYAEMGVPEYWRFDPKGEFFVPELVGERLIGGAYHPLTIHRDETGILRGHSDVLGLDICVRPGLELRLYDPASGEWLLTFQEAQAARQAAETAQQVAEAEREAEADARRAAEVGQQAEAGARQAAEAARQAAEAEREAEAAARQAAEAAQQVAEAEREAEAAARQAAEEENRRLRELLRSFQADQ